MSESTFRFRQFTVHQDKCAMKVGTDAVLLGCWVDPGTSKLALDVGTGTGVLALMLSQKSPLTVHAIDIDEGAYLQAKENFRISPWFNRLYPFQTSFQEFASVATVKYDLIVSNPPYFHHASKPPEESRSQARHHDHLTFEALLEGVRKIISPDGKLCVILPFREGMDFLNLAMRRSLFCQRLLKVKTKADRTEKRVLMEFSRRFGLIKESTIMIQDEHDHFTPEYIQLTREYYIQLEPQRSE